MEEIQNTDTIMVIL